MNEKLPNNNLRQSSGGRLHEGKGKDMKYEQPKIEALDSADALVRSGGTDKWISGCFDHPHPDSRVSSIGAYEIDE